VEYAQILALKIAMNLGTVSITTTTYYKSKANIKFFLELHFWSRVARCDGSKLW